MSTNHTNNTNKNRRSFTLIELLVVLALVAILSVVVILTLNPAELIKQARDSNRLSDLSTINTALNLFSADVTSGFMGTSTVVYVSIPSASPTCSGLGLPALPSTYTYNCATATNLRNTDGTGWIPVNFQRISSNSPISQLPIDPINTTSTRLYYSYVAGGSWELNATIEAAKNKLGGSGDLVSKDGGSASSQYEIGNNLNLNPLETGDPSLVGYWNFEEGPNATSSDKSGYGNHGTWGGSGVHYATGRVGNYAGDFSSSTNDSIQLPVSGAINAALNGQFTISMWANLPWPGGATSLLGPRQASSARLFGTAWSDTAIRFVEENTAVITSGYTYSNLQWFILTITYDLSNIRVYADGVLVETKPYVFSGSYTGAYTINYFSGPTYISQTGQLDEIRIYGRALSAAEILALYNSTK